MRFGFWEPPARTPVPTVQRAAITGIFWIFKLGCCLLVPQPLELERPQGAALFFRLRNVFFKTAPFVHLVFGAERKQEQTKKKDMAKPKAKKKEFQNGAFQQSVHSEDQGYLWSEKK